jgi:hypothetical protein
LKIRRDESSVTDYFSACDKVTYLSLILCGNCFIECLKIWARLFVLAFSRSERKEYQQPRRRNICRHYQLRQSKLLYVISLSYIFMY